QIANKAGVLPNKSRSLWYDAWRRLKRNKAAVISGYFIFALCIIAIFAKYLSPFSFEEQNMDYILSTPSSKYWLGTDDLGRDLFSRLIYGAQMSMAVGVFTAIFSLAMGMIYGAIAGWVGGRTDSIMMRVIDILDSIPTLVLLILVKILFDSINMFDDPETRALVGVLMALGIFGWILLARIVRGQVLQVKQSLYVEAARALGSSSISTLIKHVIPNILGPVIVVLTFQIPSNILFESFLSFIGLGLQPPFSSWGVLANAGWKTIKSYPHLILAPGCALFFTMLAFNLLGDGLRDAFDPKMK
ncbi:MAG: ABC transporter permease, partial [Bdellovibrionales bacterium]